MNKKWILLFLSAILLTLVIKTLYVAGSFKTIQPHLEGRLVGEFPGIPGPEDMDLDDSTGLLFISSADRWKTQAGLPAHDGIYVLQPDSGQQPYKLPITYSGEFHPHGISFLREGGKALLFVVNHNPSGNYVEVFEYKSDTLFHLSSIKGNAMCCPNDVVAVAPDKFYVTNDHGYKGGVMRFLEEYLQLPFSSLLYYDGAAFSTVFEGMLYGNGVNLSNDKSKLYVATTTGRNLLTFERDLLTGGVKLVNKLNLKTGVDNIDVDADGNLWIAGHPKLLAFVGHAKDSAALSPSQVLKIIPVANGEYKVEEVMMDDGKILSGSSIALRRKDQLFVGGVFQPKVLLIELKP
jgi:arylesterase / paraoxonase